MSHIKIYMSGGAVQDVEGLPEGWTYEVVDEDLDMEMESWLEERDGTQ